MMLVAYREDRDVLKTVTGVSELVEVKGDKEDMIAAANYVEDRGMTPFDAIHLVKSRREKIVSSDQDYDNHTERLKLEELI